MLHGAAKKNNKRNFKKVYPTLIGGKEHAHTPVTYSSGTLTLLLVFLGKKNKMEGDSVGPSPSSFLCKGQLVNISDFVSSMFCSNYVTALIVQTQA